MTLKSICLFCGSSNKVDTGYLKMATAMGKELAARDIRLVYGGGGIGLMGAAARAAHEAGGEVLGIMPNFLAEKEIVYQDVEHRFVETMRERKQMMFDEADAFITLPGGIGTLEEVVEILSWAVLGLHNKPMALLAPDDYWQHFTKHLDHTIEEQFTTERLSELYLETRTIEGAIEGIIERIRDDKASMLKDLI